MIGAGGAGPGSGGANGDSGDTGGCGCRLAGSEEAGMLSLLAMAAGVGAMARRTRRRDQDRRG